MENYLSIGDVAKIRNIDVQSLRYYEKLGILIPAYINPQTGYRYYSMEQLMILDTVILCIDLGIPLKRLKEYVDSDGQLEFERLLRDGKIIAEEKIAKINTGLDSIDRTLRHINEQKAFQGRTGHYSRYIYERFILSTPCEKKMEAKTYEKNLTHLFDLAKQDGLHASFPHGTISTYSDGKYLGTKMFLEVARDSSDKAEFLPGGNYLCYQEPRENRSDPTAIFPGELFAGKDVDVIVSSMSPNTYKYDKVIMEFQIIT